MLCYAMLCYAMPKVHCFSISDAADYRSRELPNPSTSSEPEHLFRTRAPLPNPSTSSEPEHLGLASAGPMSLHFVMSARFLDPLFVSADIATSLDLEGDSGILFLRSIIGEGWCAHRTYIRTHRTYIRKVREPCHAWVARIAPRLATRRVARGMRNEPHCERARCATRLA